MAKKPAKRPSRKERIAMLLGLRYVINNLLEAEKKGASKLSDHQKAGAKKTAGKKTADKGQVLLNAGCPPPPGGGVGCPPRG